MQPILPNTTAASDLALRPSENCWRVERASRATVIIDAADYFRAARAAMMAAEHRIMLVVSHGVV
jgi:hypothetical protein